MHLTFKVQSFLFVSWKLIIQRIISIFIILTWLHAQNLTVFGGLLEITLLFSAMYIVFYIYIIRHMPPPTRRFPEKKVQAPSRPVPTLTFQACMLVLLRGRVVQSAGVMPRKYRSINSNSLVTLHSHCTHPLAGKAFKPWYLSICSFQPKQNHILCNTVIQ